MGNDYGMALTHALLAGTGIFCLQRYHRSESLLKLPIGAYGIVTAHSIIGALRWGLPDDMADGLDKAYEFTKYLQSLFALPCIAGETWLNYGYYKELGYAHPGLSLIPLAAYLADKRRDDLVDGILVLNMISMGTVSVWSDNRYGLAAVIIYAVNHFLIRDKEDIQNIPSPILYNLVMCIFTYISHRSLGGRAISLD